MVQAHTHAQSIRILGIPMDLGQQRRGVDMGPSALRYAGLYDRLAKEGHQVEDLGNLDVPVRDESSVRAHGWVEANGGGLRHLPEVIEACQAIYEEAKKCAGSEVLPLFLGGDHSIAIGTVAGITCGGPLGCCGWMRMVTSTRPRHRPAAIFTACRWRR